MSFFELVYFYFSKALQCLYIHKLRSLLSALGIMFGVMALIAMLSIGAGAKKEILDQLEKLGTHHLIIKQNEPSSDQKIEFLAHKSDGLSFEDGQAIVATIPGAADFCPVKILTAKIHDLEENFSPALLAVTSSYSNFKALKLQEGRFICDIDRKNKAPVCVVGQEVAKKLGTKGHLGRSILIENVSFEIVGILQNQLWKENKKLPIEQFNNNKTIFIPLFSHSLLPKSLHLLDDYLNEITIAFNKNIQVASAAHPSQRLLFLRHHNKENFQIIIPQALLEQSRKTSQTFDLVLGTIAAISLITGGIGIMNIMLANVSERTKEIGIRRALGANFYQILTHFLVEAILLTGFGALLGIVLGIVSSFTISYFAGWTTIVTSFSLILSLLMALITGIISGVYPAYKAATISPIIALRTE